MRRRLDEIVQLRDQEQENNTADAAASTLAAAAGEDDSAVIQEVTEEEAAEIQALMQERERYGPVNCCESPLDFVLRGQSSPLASAAS